MMITTLATITGKAANDNMRSFLAGMELGGHMIEWHKPQVQAHLLGQVLHESGGFTYDREIWGNPPTAAQRGYEDRADLGHSALVPGEAFLFRGKTAMQITGRANHAEFRDWSRANVDPQAPDFEAKPELLLTDPWEGLGVVWYWHTRKLTPLALANDLLNVTRRINGGYNGLEDRERWFARAALIMLGQSSSVAAYQRKVGLAPIDGIPGPNTRRALFTELGKLPDDKTVDSASSELDKARGKLTRIAAILEE